MSNLKDKELAKFRTQAGEIVVAVTDSQVSGKLDQLIASSSGGGISQIELAAGTVSAIRLVKLNINNKLIYSTNNANPADAQVLGVSLTGGNADAAIKVLTFGKLTDSSLNFLLDSDLFLGINGNIVDTAPTSGVYLKIGKMVGVNTMFVDIEQPIIL